MLQDAARHPLLYPPFAVTSPTNSQPSNICRRRRNTHSSRSLLADMSTDRLYVRSRLGELFFKVGEVLHSSPMRHKGVGHHGQAKGVRRVPSLFRSLVQHILFSPFAQREKGFTPQRRLVMEGGMIPRMVLGCEGSHNGESPANEMVSAKLKARSRVGPSTTAQDKSAPWRWLLSPDMHRTASLCNRWCEQ